MDPFIAALANMGGVGILAAALFLLLKDTIHRFTRELEQTRHTFTQELREEREQCHLDHTAMMTGLQQILEEVRQRPVSTAGLQQILEEVRQRPVSTTGIRRQK